MTNIFDAKIMCRNCNLEMKQTIVNKNGAQLRAVKCPKCGDVIVHPADLNSMEHFKDLKGKTFSVKLRMVGNSHAVSIPKEIVDFMSEREKDMHENMQAHMHRAQKQMNEMVRLCLEDFGKISMSFGDLDEDDFDDESGFDEEEGENKPIDKMKLKKVREIQDDR